MILPLPSRIAASLLIAISMVSGTPSAYAMLEAEPTADQIVRVSCQNEEKAAKAALAALVSATDAQTKNEEAINTFFQLSTELTAKIAKETDPQKIQDLENKLAQNQKDWDAAEEKSGPLLQAFMDAGKALIKAEAALAACKEKNKVNVAMEGDTNLVPSEEVTQ